MKKRDLEKKLKKLGWRLLQSRKRGPHEIWTNGERLIALPRHREISEGTARSILKEAGKV